MAKPTPEPYPLSAISPIFFFLSLLIVAGNSQPFSKHLTKKQLGLKKEKLTHLHFYFHDIVSGTKPTAVQIASAAMTNNSSTGFGLMFIVDDPLTLTPELGSKQVGRAQGIYASAAFDEVGLLMVLTYTFTVGEYNGSSVSILGRNRVFSAVREMPVVGGTGVFKFARGYAHASTVWFNSKGDATVEYNVYVLHH